MRGKYQVVLLALFAMTLLILPTAARAGTNLGLQLQSGSTTDTICDNNINFAGCTSNTPDGLPTTVGAVLFAGSVGSWNVQTTTGTSQPVLNLPELLDMTNTSINTSGGGSPITLTLTLTGVTTPSGITQLVNAIGGTATGGNVTTTINVWLSQTNTAFCASGTCGTDVLTKTFNTSGTGQILAATTIGSVNTGGGPYSLTLQITVDGHGGSANVTFDDSLSVPEPATLSILGAALLALGTGLRKKLLRP